MKVLLTTDGEASSAGAETLFRRLADRATVDVTAYGVTTYTIGSSAEEGESHSLATARERTKQLAEGIAERLGGDGFRVTAATGEGDPGAEIVRKVEGESYDLTVLGAGRHSWLRSRLLGTTSSYVLHNSPSSVLVVHDGPEREDALKVLVATDGSESATSAARSFARFAHAPSCTVTVLAVARTPSFAPEKNLVDADDVATAQQEMNARAQQDVDDIVQLFAAEGLTAVGEVHRGSPASTLLEMAERGRFDVVVLGSRGLGPVRSALLGSVSDQVSHHARASFVARGADR